MIRCGENITSYWGCSNSSSSFNDSRREIGIIVTDQKNRVLFNQRMIPGFHAMSKEIVFTKPVFEEAPIIEQLPLKLRVWFEQDFMNTNETEQEGKIRVQASITVAQSKDEEMKKAQKDPGINSYY